MKIHEYQAKEMFAEFDVPVGSCAVATTTAEAVQAAQSCGLPVVIKAQVHVGGRGKAGGVKVVSEASEVESTAATILGLTIKDLPVRKLLIAPAVDIKTEVYLSLLIDRGTSEAMFIGCKDGGIEIEETAKTNPEKIIQFPVPAASLTSLAPADVKPLAAQLFDDEKHVNQCAELLVKVAKCFRERDLDLLEINPLIVDGDDNVMALDAKVMCDDNALGRQAKNVTYRDMDSEDIDELEAKEAGLSFIRLDGEIGCMVNGAGLAMATMDIIKHFGGSPANFLDVGGSSNPDKVVVAFQKILKDPKVKVIFINIFGGITRCDDIAKGILKATSEFEVGVPIIIRLVGTNETEGRKLLEGTDLIVATTLEGGAKQAVEIASKG